MAASVFMVCSAWIADFIVGNVSIRPLSVSEVGPAGPEGDTLDS